MALAEREGTRVAAVEEVAIGPPKKQSDLLPALAMELLQRHRVPLASLAGIAVGLGPGSFTGLRIGLATAKALAYVAQIKIAGASSLACIALEGPEDVPLMPTAVARQGELYVGFYRRRGDAVDQMEPEAALTPLELSRLLEQRREAIALGPGIGPYREQLESLGAPPARLIARPDHPSALAVAKLTAFPEQVDLKALFALEPHYVRSSEAERNPAFPAPPGPRPSARILGG
jgi:tRNA threonylcarbamoyladenosine biosynthesis protein TsaB